MEEKGMCRDKIIDFCFLNFLKRELIVSLYTFPLARNYQKASRPSKLNVMIGEKIIIPPQRRRSANEHRYSQQMKESERDREMIDRKTFQR